MNQVALEMTGVASKAAGWDLPRKKVKGSSPSPKRNEVSVWML